MKIRRGSRRSIRYSFFIGILAGSIFSGSGAFADPLTQATFYSTISTNLSGTYVLGENIDITTADNGTAPSGPTVFGSFIGTLDGANKKITGLTKPLFDYIGGSVSNLVLEAGTVAGQGILSNISGSESTISNVSASGEVTSSSVNTGGLVGESHGLITGSSTSGSVESDSQYLGGLVGYSTGEVTNSSSSMSVSGEQDYVGGLIGATTGLVSSSHASGAVTGDIGGVGGLIGYVNGASETVRVTASYASGSVDGYLIAGGLIGITEGTVIIGESYATGSTETHTGNSAGGLIGYAGLNSGTTEISESYATGSTTGASSHVGGLVGYSEGTMLISQSYATGDVAGTSNVGGLIGYLFNGEISNSYSTGAVTGSGEYIGGFVGDAYGTIEDSFATGDVTGTGEFDHGVGGFAGYLGGYLINTYATGDVNGFNEVGGLVGSTGSSASITNSYATGNVNGTDDVGGLVGLLDQWHAISNSYATGDVTGDDNIGGLVGSLHLDASITNSYATGDVAATINDGSGDVGGLVGDAEGAITNSHASGDVTGFYDVGGLVGDLQNAGSITNSYATGNTSAAGSDGSWSNGWGGLVGESSGLISNSYATGNVFADYNYGSLIGYLMLDESLDSQIVNSFATGSTSSANNDVTLDGGEELFGLGGFVGCAVEDSLEGYSYTCLDSYKSFPETTPSILSIVNTVDDGDESGFEIVACKNNGLPSLSELIDSYENTCVTLSGSNRERRIRDFIQTTAITEIAKTLGFVISPKFSNNASVGFIKNEKELAISKILGAQKAADRVARTSMKTGEALQISYNFDSKDPIELWVKLPDGKWILAGVINFDKNGKAVLPPKQFKVAGEYVLVLNKPSEDSVKANAPLNQIGSLTVFVN